MIKKVILISVLTLSIAFYLTGSTGMDKGHITVLLIGVMIGLLLFIFNKEKNILLKGQYLKHSTLVIFGFIVVHFQYHIDYLLGYIGYYYPYIWVSPSIVAQALSVSVSGFIAFLLGYFTYKSKKQKIICSKDSPSILDTRVLVYFSALLLATYFYFANPLYLIGFYGVEALGTEAQYIILLFKVVVFAVLIQTARNFYVQNKKFSNFLQYAKSHSLLLNVLIGVYLLSVTISGDRGPLIFFFIAYFGNYLFATQNKLNIYKTISILIIGAVFITILGKVRSLDRSLSFSERFSTSLKMESRFETKSILPQTQELATSIRALHHTMDYIPSHHDYLYGRFQFQQIMSMIPFGNSLVQQIFDDNSYKYGGSSRFITWLILGDNPYMGHGTSVTSDFYFDFGILGVVLGMFIFGFTMRFAELAMYSKRLPTYFAHAFFIGFLSSAIYISRSTYLIEMKAILWTFLILILNQKVINRNDKNSNSYPNP